jgi:hypothetical protein
MNKFEKLIEYIINDEDQKARELFHTIVVEKSRDIYESIMDEENMEEKVHGDEVGDMVDEISSEEHMHEEGEDEFDMDQEEGDDDEFSMDHEGEDDEPAGEFPSDGNETEHEIEDQVMSIDSKLDDLLAKFDEIMGHDAMGAEHNDQEEVVKPEMEDMMEDDEESGKSGKSGKSGTSGSAKMEAAKAGSAVSGKSGSAKSGMSGKSGSGKMESRKSASEMMREYVEKIEDINLTPNTFGEGEPVGAGTGTKKVSVNTKAGSVGPGADFGGTEKNLVSGKGNNEAPDGKPIETPKNEYSKGETEQPLARKNGGYKNKVGGNTPWNAKEPSYKDGGDGQNKETGKKVGSAKDGSVSVNKKSELGQAGQPTGKKQ